MPIDGAPAPSTDTASIPAASSAAIAEIARRGRELTDRLADMVDTVTNAVSDGDDGSTEALALFGWYRSDLLPQFKAVDAALYARGRERETTALLVQALTKDHAQLKELFENLDAVEDPGAAASTAGAVAALYASHLAKEIELLLPALAKAGVSIADLTRDRPELVGGARKQAAAQAHVVTGPDGGAPKIAPISGTEELDVRALSHQARHGVILGKMQALTSTGALVLINDHDPLPLKYQAEAMWPDQFEWTYLDEGPVEWRVSIARV